MEEKPHKKGLHIKVAIITLMAVILPLILTVFITPNPLYFIPIGISIALLAIVVIYILLKPIGSLLKGTEILSRGNFNYRIDQRTGDEFETLGESFNLMAEKLQQSFISLEKDKDIILSERNKLEMVLSSIIDGIIAIDMSKNIALMNKAAESMTGYSLQEMQGRPIDQFIHFFIDQEEVTPKAYCQTNFNQVLKLVGQDAKQVKVNLSASKVFEGVQTNLGCILILHDLSKEQELEQMKLDFVSMASHELKTPLTSIVGYLSVFLSENSSKISKQDLELLNRSFVSARQLLTLVENILSVNKIERDKFSVTAEPIDYLSVLSKAVEDLENQAKLKNITLTLSLPTSLPKVMADPIRTAEVVNNLVSNAINYTNSGGVVSVYTTVSPTEVTTTVEDTGIGIPKEAIPHLFNKFFRVSGNLQKGPKGTGLGLYIAKSIITKLNGTIWVESEVGKGSKFYFSLPIAPQVGIDTQKFAKEAILSGSLNY